MRLRNLVLALVAASSLPAMAPAGAWAQKHPSPHGRCGVSINVVPRLIESGESVSAFGRLRCANRGGGAGRTVRLLQHTRGTPGFSVVQTTSTDGAGFYELTTGSISANSVFYVRSRGAASGFRAVMVLAHVTLTGPPAGTQLLTGVASRVTFAGSMSPAEVGALVVLQRQNAASGNEWHRIDAGRVGSGGGYSITHTFVVPGDANIRVLVRSQRRNVPSPSEVLNYEISQAQNPQLTIQASADPIVCAQTVTLSGVLSAAPTGTPVTLLARSARQLGFAPVSEAKTDSGGDYGFPAQSPIASTFYEVRGAGRTSAVLYEGVKDVLSAEVSTDSIQAGQPLTFSGSVAPDHTGHVIYLEQQNRSGIGFHVVQVATVGAGSKYSIVRTVYGAGIEVFRVKIPGGPENEGSASSPFTIHVTAAPAAALGPEGPGNTTVPPEGEI